MGFDTRPCPAFVVSGDTGNGSQDGGGLGSHPGTERNRREGQHSLTSKLHVHSGEEHLAAKCWIAVNRTSTCQVTELRHLTQDCENYVQVVKVSQPGQGTVTVVNVYDRHKTGEGDRPAQRAAWGEIAKPESRLSLGT